MRAIDWIALTICYFIFSTLAFAHEGHQMSEPAPDAALPMPGSVRPGAAPVQRLATAIS